MFDFHQKRKLRTIANSRVTQAVLVVLVLLVMWSAFDRYLIAKEMADKRSAVESEISDLEDRRDTLEAEVQYLSNERGIEAEMRRQFDIARNGEQVVIILDDEKEDEEKVSTTTEKQARPWYKFW